MERSPPDSDQWPPAWAESLMRMPRMGLAVKLFGALDDQRQFVGHLHHQDAGEADFGGVEAEVDEFLVLVAVADQHRLLVAHHAHGGDQFGLGAGLQAMMVAASRTG